MVKGLIIKVNQGMDKDSINKVIEGIKNTDGISSVDIIDDSEEDFFLDSKFSSYLKSKIFDLFS